MIWYRFSRPGAIFNSFDFICFWSGRLYVIWFILWVRAETMKRALGFIRILSQKHKIVINIQTLIKILQKVWKTRDWSPGNRCFCSYSVHCSERQRILDFSVVIMYYGAIFFNLILKITACYVSEQGHVLSFHPYAESFVISGVRRNLNYFTGQQWFSINQYFW
jgi:hypothetical protein